LLRTPDHAIGCALHSNRSHDAVIHVYDAARKVMEMRQHNGISKSASFDVKNSPNVQF
jgi:hypothetical protein